MSSKASATTVATGARILGFLERHPASSLFVIALATRFVLASILAARRTTTFIDETTYVYLARTLSAGEMRMGIVSRSRLESYRLLRGYVVPHAVLTDLLGATRLVGALWSALLGACVVGLTVIAVRARASARRALVAGTVVLLLPSQVVLSSVALRESTVWLCLVIVGISVALLPRAAGSQQLMLGTLVVGALLWLWWTRQQTAMIATAAVTLIFLVEAVRARRWSALLVVAAVLLAPAFVGAGVAGSRFATTELGRLDVTRSNMAVGADSAIDERPAALQRIHGVRNPLAQEIRGALERIPRGTAAILFRPYPWETTGTLQSRAARLENLLWVPLYVAAAAGAVRRWRSDPLALFAVLVIVGIVGLAAVSQGNLGTAYRHRGQILWALAVLAAAAPPVRLRRLAPAAGERAER